MSSDLRPIETAYRGYRFRSRLEARTAVLLDALGLKYEYEPQGFNLDGVYYLPDFWLPGFAAWLEVKPTWSWDSCGLELRKAHALAAKSGRLVFIQHGDIPFPSPDLAGESAICIAPGGDEDFPYLWCICPWCARIGLEFQGRCERLACGCAAQNGVRRPLPTAAAPLIEAAYGAARSARFEHGESGPGQTRATAQAGPNGLDPDQRRLLDRIPQNQRGTLANWMLEPIRSGMLDPELVIQHVEKHILRRLADAWRYRDTSWATEDAFKLGVIRSAVQDHRDEALALAGYYVAYESLPRAEREKIKARNHAAIQSVMPESGSIAERQAAFIADILRRRQGI